MNFTIRTRLTAVYCAIFCLGMVFLEAGAYFGLNASIHAVVDRELDARLLGLTEFLDDHVARRPLPRVQSEIRTHGALQPAFLAIFDGAGREIFQSQAMRGLFVTGRGAGHDAVWTAQGRTGPMRIMGARRTVHGNEYDLYLATDLTVPFEIMRRFRWILFFSAPLALACASFAGYWIAGRALAPVAELTRTARNIGGANLGQRVRVPQSSDEIHELAITLNGMLARIDDAFRHVAQFTADASHELRTPLAVIRTTAEVALLRATGNSDSYREALHRILREAEKNSDLLENLLRLARADSAARELPLHPLDAGQCVAQACERMDLVARERNVTLRLETAREPLPIAADADHLLRLCLILLDNAIKYTPPGGTVTATAARNAGMVSVTVADTGIGIAAQDLPLIFGRFFRTADARCHEAGAGLGLSIAQWIAEAHHATISVVSLPGEGSVFRVDFPRIDGPLADSREAGTASRAGTHQIS